MKRYILILGLLGIVFAAPMQYFTMDDLATYNGQQGQPAYVAVDGSVFNVTSANSWVNGGCRGYMSGQDITGISDLSVNIRTVVKKQPVVGRYVERMTKRQVSHHTGEKGKPASIIYNGMIYDVSNVRNLRPFAGQDLSTRNINVTNLKIIGKVL